MGQTRNVDPRGKRSHAARLPLVSWALGPNAAGTVAFFPPPDKHGPECDEPWEGLPSLFCCQGGGQWDKKAKSKNPDRTAAAIITVRDKLVPA
jgi:hypothetical protein